MYQLCLNARNAAWPDRLLKSFASDLLLGSLSLFLICLFSHYGDRQLLRLWLWRFFLDENRHYGRWIVMLLNKSSGSMCGRTRICGRSFCRATHNLVSLGLGKADLFLVGGGVGTMIGQRLQGRLADTIDNECGRRLILLSLALTLKASRNINRTRRLSRGWDWTCKRSLELFRCFWNFLSAFWLVRLTWCTRGWRLSQPYDEANQA